MDAADIIRSVHSLAEEQAGAFTVRQATKLGASAKLVRVRQGSGEWISRGRGLLIVAGAPRCWQQDLWLAHLAAGPASVASGPAAAHIHGLAGYRRPAIEVTVPVGGSHGPPFGTLRETRWLPGSEIVQVPRLPAVTPVALTIMHLAGQPPHPATFRRPDLLATHKKRMERILSRAIGRQRLTMTQMIRVVALMGRHGLAGSTIMREIVLEAGPDFVPTDSDLEDLWLELAAAAGLPEPIRQHTVVSDEGWLGKVDFAYLEFLTMVEIDGPDHDAPVQKRYDAERDAAMRRAGLEVVRIHWTVLIGAPNRALRAVNQAFCR
jgi:hypothetical protein